MSATTDKKSSLKKRTDEAPRITDLRHTKIDKTEVDQARNSSIMSSNSEPLNSILKASLGLEANGLTTGISISHETENRLAVHLIRTCNRSDRLTSVTSEILMEQEEIDIHPYGRGGVYEGILYKRKEDEPPNVLELFLWFILFGSLVMISVLIVFVAGKGRYYELASFIELSYFLHTETTVSKRKAPCEFFKNCGKI
ncbi:hypothetical protein P879_03922 [Paragonimus westermani]|uniref:Uncharacterized protein n=1 Tax=Paragonimus westermani TaxID=34504 RepID=A0A8T0DHV9_9TREM|nr:hypothetical protein P879_03922 [Paragonimus westermani]